MVVTFSSWKSLVDEFDEHVVAVGEDTKVQLKFHQRYVTDEMWSPRKLVVGESVERAIVVQEETSSYLEFYQRDVTDGMRKLVPKTFW